MKNIMITTAKSDKGELTRVNAASFAPIKPDEFIAVDSINTTFCFNVLAANVDELIKEAHAKHGGIARMFPNKSNADRSAIKYLLDQDNASLQDAWQLWVDSKKKVKANALTLQGLQKAHKAMFAEPTEKPASFKDQFLAVWDALPAKTQLAKTNVALYDLAINAGWEPKQ
jgi:hypothetical protein